MKQEENGIDPVNIIVIDGGGSSGMSTPMLLAVGLPVFC